MMVTGDYHHTAIAVARGVGMIPPHEHVVIIQTLAEHAGTLSHHLSMDKAEPSIGHMSSVSRKQSIARGVSFAADLLSPTQSLTSLPGEVVQASIGPGLSPTLAVQATSQISKSPAHAWQSQKMATKSPSRLSLSQKQLMLPPDRSKRSPNRAQGPPGRSLASQKQLFLSQHRPSELPDGHFHFPGRSSASQKQLLLSQRRSSQSPERSSASWNQLVLSLPQSLSLLAASLSVPHNFSQSPESQVIEGSSDGLAFSFDNGDAFEDGDALKALSSIAQVLQ